MAWITTFLTPYLMPLIAILLGCIGIQTWRLDSAQEALSKISQTAETYQTQTDKNLEVLRESIPIMVDKARDNAVNTYVKRYGDAGCNHDSGDLPNRVLPSSYGETNGSSGANETTGKQLACTTEFIASCAADAQTIIEWQRWVKLNDLEVK